MPKQKGAMPIEGTMGNVTYYKTRDGYGVRGKGGVDGSRIATDPKFARTRENGAEFGRAGKAGRLLRTALRPLLKNVADGKVTSRLTKHFVRVVKADAVNSRGMRNVTDGNLALLLGFDFNIRSTLASTLFAPYTAAIDRATGAASVQIPAFLPEEAISAPPAATHFKLSCGSAEIDFENEVPVGGAASTANLPLDVPVAEAINLTANLPAGSEHPLFLTLSIEFSQEVNGVMYPLNSEGFNAMALVGISEAA